jgi:hypothetical protein
MFDERDHICCCHGCGAFHVVRSRFLGAGLLLRFDSTQRPGVLWAVPAHACPTCHALKPERIEDHPIRRAFDHGMTAEARARADREFREQWERRLDAAEVEARR